jgi:hypothetical protein
LSDDVVQQVARLRAESERNYQLMREGLDILHQWTQSRLPGSIEDNLSYDLQMRQKTYAYFEKVGVVRDYDPENDSLRVAPLKVIKIEQGTGEVKP